MFGGAGGYERRDAAGEHRTSRDKLIDLLPAEHEDVVRSLDRPSFDETTTHGAHDVAATGVEQGLLESGPLAKCDRSLSGAQDREHRDGLVRGAPDQRAPKRAGFGATFLRLTRHRVSGRLAVAD